MLSGYILWVFVNFLPGLSRAQITLDGTVGQKSALAGPDYKIGADVGRQVGNNLFHSFGEFNVHTGESATFTGPQNIQNVIGRVTGGQVSEIDGTIRSEMPQADLYLLNPQGMLFGPHASLDVPAGFHVSTADYLKLSDGGRFAATQPEGSVLTAAPPVAFGFLGPNPAPITIQGSTLQVGEGKTLSLIGGDLTVEGGQLHAPSGRLNVVSVASAGEAVSSPPDQPPDPQVNSFSQLGKIMFTKGAVLDASGEGAGSVLVRGAKVGIDNARIVAKTLGKRDGASVGIDLQADQLTLTNGAQINSDTLGSGRGGAITLTATEGIIIRGQNSEGFAASAVATTTSGPGDGGRVVIMTPSLLIEGGFIRADARPVSTGKPGDVIVATLSRPMEGGIVNPDVSGITGNAGDIEIQARNISLTEGAAITSVTLGSGHGGAIILTATEGIIIRGQESARIDSAVSTATETTGDAGRVLITTPSLTVDFGFIGAGTAPFSTGNAGDIEIQVGHLILTTAAAIGSETGGSGHGGTITLTATKDITIKGKDSEGLRSTVLTTTLSTGDAGHLVITTPSLLVDFSLIRADASSSMGMAANAGDITIEVGQLTLTNGAAIDSRTRGNGHGGTITLTATTGITIMGQDNEGFRSRVLTSTTSSGNAGRVVITTPSLLIDQSIIQALADTESTGTAGDIEIQAERLTLAHGAQIDSSTFGGGQGGNIIVTTLKDLSITGRDGEGNPSGVFSNTSGPSPGGSIVVHARQVTLQDGGTLSAQSTGTGNAGSIVVAAETLRSHQGSITTAATQAGGGQIELSADETMEFVNSAVITTVQGGSGDAGNITINTINPQAVVLNRSKVIAQAQQGNGGNISINADLFLATPDSVVDASSQGGGISGTIDIRGVVNNVSGSLAPLSQQYQNVAALVADRCARRMREGGVSSFVVTGRSGLPLQPGGLLPSIPTNIAPTDRTKRSAASFQRPKEGKPAELTRLRWERACRP